MRKAFLEAKENEQATPREVPLFHNSYLSVNYHSPAAVIIRTAWLRTGIDSPEADPRVSDNLTYDIYQTEGAPASGEGFFNTRH